MWYTGLLLSDHSVGYQPVPERAAITASLPRRRIHNTNQRTDAPPTDCFDLDLEECTRFTRKRRSLFHGLFPWKWHVWSTSRVALLRPGKHTIPHFICSRLVLYCTVRYTPSSLTLVKTCILECVKSNHWTTLKQSRLSQTKYLSIAIGNASSRWSEW